MTPLPTDIAAMLDQFDASPRLIAHLQLVFNVALTLTQKLDLVWPDLRYDRAIVHMGAAIHDIGKIAYPAELGGPGHDHELAGEPFLLSQGFPERIARICRTHAQWASEQKITIEDLLVAAADTWWRGKRDTMLETSMIQAIILQTHEEPWQVFFHLDTIATAITDHAEARLAWQNQHPI